MTLIPEFRLFETCLDSDKKQTMLKALDTYLESLEKRQASRILVRDAVWLRDEINKMKVCP